MKTNYFTKIMTCVLTATTILLTIQLKAQPWSVSLPGSAICPRTIEAKDIIYSNGNLYAAGTKYNSGGHYDMYVSKTNLVGTVLTSAARDYNGMDDIPVKIKKDGSGNIYVLSTAGYGNNDRDMWLVKYDANLVFLWSAYYHSGDEVAVDMTVSGSFVYVTGNSISATKGSDIVLVKFTTAGIFSASSAYSVAVNTDNDVAKEMIFDGTYFYICGYSQNATTGRDGVILKYNTSLVSQWSQVYSPLGGGYSDEVFNSLVVNGSNVFAGGSGWTLTTKNDFLLAKFNKSTGAYVSKISTNSTSLNDEIRKVCTFGTNIYVTGITETSTSPLKNKVVTSKYSTGLVQAALWPIKFQPVTENFECNDMKINNFGTVAIAGTQKLISTSGVAYTSSFTLLYNTSATKLEEYITPSNVGCNTVESSGNAVVFTDANYDFNIAVAGGNKAWFSTVQNISSHRIEITSTLLKPAGDDSNVPSSEAKNGATSIDQTEAEFKAFPNPAFNELHLSGNKTITGYSIFNLDGKVLKSEVTDQKELHIDISKLAQGTYVITIQSESEKTTKRFIKM